MSIRPLPLCPTTTFIQAWPRCYGFQVSPAGLLLRSSWSALPETSLHYVICHPGARFGSELFSKRIHGFVPDIELLRTRCQQTQQHWSLSCLFPFCPFPETPGRTWDKRRGRGRSSDRAQAEAVTRVTRECEASWEEYIAPCCKTAMLSCAASPLVIPFHLQTCKKKKMGTCCHLM